MMAESKKGKNISQDKGFHEICKEGLLSVDASSSSGSGAIMFTRNLKKKKKSENKGKVNLSVNL